MKGLKRTYDTHIQSYTQFKSKVEAAVDLGPSAAKKKKANRRRPQGDGVEGGNEDD
jgi:hypothetical protein